MKLQSKLLIYLLFLVYSPLKAQNVTLTGTIYDYATYYVSSFDPQTGASDFQLFRYTLSSDSYPVWVKISFRATMVSPALGINTETAILDLYTSAFVVENDIRERLTKQLHEMIFYVVVSWCVSPSNHKIAYVFLK